MSEQLLTQRDNAPRSAHQPDRLGIACVWCRNPWPCAVAKEDQ